MTINYNDKYLGDLFTWQDANEIKRVVNYNVGLIPNVPIWAQTPTKPDYTSTEIISYLEYTPESINNKGIPNGYAPLNEYGKVPDSYLPSITSSKLIRVQIPADGVANNDTGIISGTSTFNLPTDFDKDSVNFVQDGSMLAQYTINSSVTPNTITFNLVPLSGTCFLFYYSL